MAEALSFEIISDIGAILPQKIDTNFEAVKSGLEQMIAPYAALVVTEDGIAGAKKDLASLRKLKDNINAQKIAVKKEWMAPYTAFEEQPKELMAIVEKAIGNLDGQIKAYDEERRAAKLSALRAFFTDTAYELNVDGYLTWDGIFNPKWLNATFSEDAAKDEIRASCVHSQEDLNFIRGTHSEFEAAMLDEYSRSRDLRAALNTGNRLKSIQKAERDAKAALEAETREDEKNAADGDLAHPAGSFAPTIVPTADMIRPMEDAAFAQRETLYTLVFELKMTAKQARAFKDFADAQGIQYRKL